MEVKYGLINKDKREVGGGRLANSSIQNIVHCPVIFLGHFDNEPQTGPGNYSVEVQ